MAMEIQILSPEQGTCLPTIQWNFEQLKEQIVSGLIKYKGLVYTDADITNAKKDRATLNKLATAIDDKRKEMKAMYLQPYEEFERQAKELTTMVKSQANEIDAQIKAYDESRKTEKLNHIKQFYIDKATDLVELIPYERIHEPKWLNVSVSLKNVEDAVLEKLESIRSSLNSITSLHSEFEAQIKDCYLRTFNLSAALSENERLAKQKENLLAYEAKRQQELPLTKQNEPGPTSLVSSIPEANTSTDSTTVSDDVEVFTIDFRVKNATKDQLNKLKAFLKENKIEYGPVK